MTGSVRPRRGRRARVSPAAEENGLAIHHDQQFGQTHEGDTPMLRQSAFAVACLTAVAIFAPLTDSRAQEPADKEIAGLAGEWKISYSNGAVREYAIDKQGKVSFDAENLKGKITRKKEGLVLVFEGDEKLERLTSGSEGRLIIKHYNPKSDFPDNKPVALGIGVRQK